MRLFFYLLNILIITGLAYWMWRERAPHSLKTYFWPAFLFKIVCGLLLTWYYNVYFGGGDARLFQSQADLVTEYAWVSPGSYLRLLLTRQYESETLRTSMVYFWYSNSYFMVMVLSFLNLFTGGHHYLNNLYFTLFSFWGLWQLVTCLAKLNQQFKFPALISFLFFPSVVFWSAGVGKEAIYLGSLAWLVAAVLRLVYNSKSASLRNYLEIIAAGYLLWKIKFYFAVLVFALLFGFAAVEVLTCKYRFFKKAQVRWYFLAFVLVAGGVLVMKEKEVINIENFFFQLMRSYSVLTERSVGKPVLTFPGLEPTFNSLLWHSPSAIMQAILRPFVWEVYNVFYFVAGLENLVVLGLLVLTAVKVVRKFPVQVSLGAWAIIIYILVIAALIGLFTPNLGSLSRYKSAFMPFLIFIILTFNFNFLDLVWNKTRNVITGLNKR